MCVCVLCVCVTSFPDKSKEVWPDKSEEVWPDKSKEVWSVSTTSFVVVFQKGNEQ